MDNVNISARHVTGVYIGFRPGVPNSNNMRAKRIILKSKANCTSLLRNKEKTHFHQILPQAFNNKTNKYILPERKTVLPYSFA
jgi:hypothetical protein